MNPSRPSIRPLLLLGLACASPLLAGLPVRAEEGAAVSIAVRTLAGADFDLAQLRGHVVVVHYWATWCPPCIHEMPQLQAFYAHYRDRGVEVLALSEDRTRDLAEVQRMVQHMAAGYPVAMAHQARANSLGDPNTLPVTYVIDGTGRVRAQLRPDTQPLTEEALARAVDPLLTGAR